MKNDPANCFIGCTCTSVDLEEVSAKDEADCFIGCTCTSVDLEEDTSKAAK